MSSLRNMAERIKTLDAEKKNLLLEIEELKKMAESKTRALEGEVDMLREEVESMRMLLGAKTTDPTKNEPLESQVDMLSKDVESLKIPLGAKTTDRQKAEPEETSSEEAQSPVNAEKPERKKFKINLFRRRK